MTSKHAACVLFLPVVFASSLAAQSDQERLNGTVADASGAVIPGAEILVRNQKNGQDRQVKANEQGLFFVINLPPAQYTMTARAEGLGPAEYRDVSLTAGQERTQNIVTITSVSAAAPTSRTPFASTA